MSSENSNYFSFLTNPYLPLFLFLVLLQGITSSVTLTSRKASEHPQNPLTSRKESEHPQNPEDGATSLGYRDTGSCEPPPRGSRN